MIKYWVLLFMNKNLFSQKIIFKKIIENFLLKGFFVELKYFSIIREVEI